MVKHSFTMVKQCFTKFTHLACHKWPHESNEGMHIFSLRGVLLNIYRDLPVSKRGGDAREGGGASIKMIVRYTLIKCMHM